MFKNCFKKQVFICTFLSFAFSLYGIVGHCQNVNLQNAKEALDALNFVSANELIQKAEKHPQTRELSETWYYSFLIKLNLTSVSNQEAKAVHFESAGIAAKTAFDLGITDSLKQIIYKKSNENINIILNNAQKASLNSQTKEAFTIYKSVFCLIESSTLEKPPIYSIGIQYAKNNQQYEKAISYADYCVKNNYKPKEHILEKVSAWNSLNKKSRSFSEVKEAYEKYPNSETFLVLYVEMLMDRKLLFSANDVIKDALEKKPENPEYLYLKGLINLGVDTELAIQSFKKSISIEPLHYNANFELGKVLLDEGKLLNNAKYFKEAKLYLEAVKEVGESKEEYLKVMEDLYLHNQDFENYQRIRKLRGN